MESSLRNRKFKYISIKLFREEGYLSTDILHFQYHPISDTINVYEVLSFNKQRIIYNKICERFVKKSKSSRPDEIKNNMRELIRKEPTISAQKIKEVTGYNWHMVTRYYMILKKELNKN